MSVSSLFLGLVYHGAVGRKNTAFVVNERYVVGLDLSVALIAAQLSCRLNDTKDTAAGASLGVAEETAVRVYRQAA